MILMEEAMDDYGGRLEIKPVPTQRERKVIKGLPNAVSVEASGGQAWVVHSASERKTYDLVDALRKLGFQVKGFLGWDSIEDQIKDAARRYKKKKQAKKRRVWV